MQHPHYSQVTTSEPTACTAPSPDSAALYSEPNSLCLQADPRACHGCTAAAAAALQAPTNANANANSAFYKYLSPDLLR
jgi:hypothetical protein